MCVRTKTSYDCGCEYKTTNHCDNSDCEGLHRIHYAKEGDCHKCKSAGIEGTRGREGKGRYAKQIKRARTKDNSHQSEAKTSPKSSVDDESPISVATTSPIAPSVDGGLSPWVSARGKEKPWETPHRKQADEAWLSEHDDRLSDLQERIENCSISKQSVPKTPSRRYVYEADECEYEDKNIKAIDQQVYTPSEKPLQIEIRKRIAGGPSRRSHSNRSHHHQDRQYSDESLPDSMPSYHSSPMLNSYNALQYRYLERHRDYDFYRSNSSPSKQSTKRYPSGSKTEPFIYNRSPYSYDDYGTPVNDFYSSKHHESLGRRYDMPNLNGHQYVKYRPTY